MATQPRLDAVDVHHAVVDSWLQGNPGTQPKDLLGKFVSLGAGTFMFKATEGRTFKDPRFRELVQIAADLGVNQIGAYHVNLRGDASLGRVDEEIANLLAPDRRTPDRGVDGRLGDVADEERSRRDRPPPAGRPGDRRHRRPDGGVVVEARRASAPGGFCSTQDCRWWNGC